MSARVTIDRRDRGQRITSFILISVCQQRPTPAVRSVHGGAEPGRAASRPRSSELSVLGKCGGGLEGLGGRGGGAGPWGASLQVQAALLCLSGLRLRATVPSQLNA